LREAQLLRDAEQAEADKKQKASALAAVAAAEEAALLMKKAQGDAK
jgi:hypothetical protein